jgi:hypothetical protein
MHELQNAADLEALSNRIVISICAATQRLDKVHLLIVAEISVDKIPPNSAEGTPHSGAAKRRFRPDLDQTV